MRKKKKICNMTEVPMLVFWHLNEFAGLKRARRVELEIKQTKIAVQQQQPLLVKLP